MKKIFLLLIVILTTSIGLAELPNILKNGDVVDAEQLNENFRFLEESQQSFQDALPEYLDNYLAGQLLENTETGYTVRDGSGDVIGSITLEKDVSADVTDDKNFWFHKDFYKARLYADGTIYSNYVYHFKLAGCQGELYIQFKIENNKNFLLPPLKGEIFKYQENLYYYPKNSDAHKFTSQSFRTTGGECIDRIGEVNWLYIQLLSNDPAVTGIQTYPFPLPITIDGLEPVTIIED